MMVANILVIFSPVVVFTILLAAFKYPLNNRSGWNEYLLCWAGGMVITILLSWIVVWGIYNMTNMNKWFSVKIEQAGKPQPALVEKQ